MDANYRRWGGYMDEDAPVFRGTREIRYAQFEKLGEAAVRANIERGRYNGERLRLAQDWLSRFDDERMLAEKSSREARMEASNSESLRIARSAKNAAWAAAIAAMIAIVVAIAMPFIIKAYGG